MEDEDTKILLDKIQLRYTETYGHPILLEDISKEYNSSITKDNILCFAGAEEGIYTALHSLLNENDHAIIITPCYQSLESIAGSICSVSHIPLQHNKNWDLDIQLVKDNLKSNTKVIIINYPHNPTGALISHDQQQEIINIAREKNIWIFSDEAYRLLEIDPKHRLEPMANLYEKAISLGVMSKSFGLAGLRIGWTVTQDLNFLKTMSEMKYYLSICNSAPSEILSIIALRNKDKILKRNIGIMSSNLQLLDNFFNNTQDIFDWIPPKGGCIGFPKIKLKISAYDFCENLRKNKGVVAIPNTVYNFKENHFRIGFGRKNMPKALDKVKNFLEQIKF
ncbi:MAG: pyridoxal phosphate-dependent aminotransferase [Legionellales bacterium]|nr:pyridoxal phosphate-dependent aminotransferase [Legionellales bacterium]